MLKKILTFNIIFLTSLCSFQVSAGSDPQYPASDFQPKIQFQSPEAAQYANTSAATTSSGRGSSDSKYPAADFQPKIQFQDQSLINESSQQQAERSAPAPVKKVAAVPAPKPTPKQISSVETSTPAKAISTASVTQASEVNGEVEETESTFGTTIFMLFMLVVLGYAFKNKLIENATPHGLGHVHTAVKPSLTGVEKYLVKQQPSATNNDAFRARPTGS